MRCRTATYYSVSYVPLFQFNLYLSKKFTAKYKTLYVNDIVEINLFGGFIWDFEIRDPSLIFVQPYRN